MKLKDPKNRRNSLSTRPITLQRVTTETKRRGVLSQTHFGDNWPENECGFFIGTSDSLQLCLLLDEIKSICVTSRGPEDI